MIKEGILAAYLLWMAAVDAKTKTVPVWPGIAGILLFSVMGVVKGQGILSLLGGIVIGAFCFTVSVLSRQAVGAEMGLSWCNRSWHWDFSIIWKFLCWRCFFAV